MSVISVRFCSADSRRRRRRSRVLELSLGPRSRQPAQGGACRSALAIGGARLLVLGTGFGRSASQDRPIPCIESAAYAQKCLLETVS
jgi:hypothetical protein